MSVFELNWVTEFQINTLTKFEVILTVHRR